MPGDDLDSPRRRLFGVTLVAASGMAAAAAGVEIPSPPTTGRRDGGTHLSIDDRLQTLLHHPAFAGHARLLLPWDDRPLDEALPLKQIGSLLPYHSHIEPRVVVDALNRMIDDVHRGQVVFSPFYPDAQRRADPTRNHTGLFFFRGKAGAPFALIAPGGGFAYVGSVHEGFPYAQEISRHGYNAFVLRYRPGLGEQAATEDMAAALSWLFTHAAELGIGTACYSVWGSSAGARMAANIGSQGAGGYGGETLPKPSIVVMAYTGHSRVARNEPPTFVVVGGEDGIAPPAVMERRVAALRAQGTRVEYRRYEGLGHGFGLGTGTAAEAWAAEAVRFWSEVSPPGR
ncbi:alpha/beta hydrolase [Ideonella sp.]|uniref:alpha/beta hydrolase n=1 Tax=Ideonella sp. TaxID=1929293 RepID=UPI003BB5D52D